VGFIDTSASVATHHTIFNTAKLYVAPTVFVPLTPPLNNQPWLQPRPPAPIPYRKAARSGQALFFCLRRTSTGRRATARMDPASDSLAIPGDPEDLTTIKASSRRRSVAWLVANVRCADAIVLSWRVSPHRPSRAHLLYLPSPSPRQLAENRVPVD
jgi:hypothetical protein